MGVIFLKVFGVEFLLYYVIVGKVGLGGCCGSLEN